MTSFFRATNTTQPGDMEDKAGVMSSSSFLPSCRSAFGWADTPKKESKRNSDRKIFCIHLIFRHKSPAIRGKTTVKALLKSGFEHNFGALQRGYLDASTDFRKPEG